MIGMQYNLQGKGVSVSEVAGSDLVSSAEAKWRKQGICVSNEPISVLDARRSPSPSTSTSTLSSSLGGGGGTGGGGGSTDNVANLAAVSGDKLQPIWPVSVPPENAVTEPAGAGGCRKDEWVSELQPLSGELDAVPGCDRIGVGLEDWESLLSESIQDQSLLRWLVGEVADDASVGFKQQLQASNPGEVGGNASLDGVVLSSTIAGAPSGNATAPETPIPASGFSGFSSNDNGKLAATIPNSSGHSKNANLLLNNNTLNPQIPILAFSNEPLPSGLNLIYQQNQLDTPEEKPQIFNPLVPSNPPLPQPSQSPNPYPPLPYTLQPPLKRPNLGFLDPRSQIPKPPFVDPVPELFLRKQNHPSQILAQQVQNHALHSHLQRPLIAQQQQNVVVYDQLCKAAELILAGNFSHAQGILARLNHQLSPVEKPFSKAAFYFKEALQSSLLILSQISPPPLRSPTPIEGMLKMGAYKLFSEASPLIHFMNFTSNQALLEAIGDAERVHVIDFDIGFGAQWASFMQELPGKNGGTKSLKITAFASPSTHHPLELWLMHENLSQFASEIGINFELEVQNIDAFDPTSHFRSSEKEKEAVAVNFPIWACSKNPSWLPPMVRFIKQLSPRIVVSLERGCERADLPFTHHLLQALHYHETLLSSIEAAKLTPEIMSKIEKFIIQPRIESTIYGRLHASDHLHPHWRALFASAGFLPVSFSNFTETQAECVLKRSQVRGFHVEKRGGSLVLYWQRRELVLASAWRCI